MVANIFEDTFQKIARYVPEYHGKPWSLWSDIWTYSSSVEKLVNNKLVKEINVSDQVRNKDITGNSKNVFIFYKSIPKFKNIGN